ncbi:hypothetical protein FNV43_RR00322 [Rhamnella rubrinervis]|uniref:Uncharacterized protein n=1 Tax=Rhamnella rubrinervis TaxID=2594499 RepID=A0A8K0HNG0_9ROSA|nr:hypothetical protein FNV43_RR00322 [Rhamnella rubrinervis]
MRLDGPPSTAVVYVALEAGGPVMELGACVGGAAREQRRANGRATTLLRKCKFDGSQDEAAPQDNDNNKKVQGRQPTAFLYCGVVACMIAEKKVWFSPVRWSNVRVCVSDVLTAACC